MPLTAGHRLIASALAALALPLLPLAASAQSPAEFYAGRTMELVIGYAAGGSNDLFARAVAQHIPKYIPGKPQMIARNMPGAGSIAAGNHTYNIAPKDGTVLCAISQGGPLQAKLQPDTVKFDPSKFGWIGRVSSSANVTFVWHTSTINTIDEAKQREITLGATGSGSTVSLYPSVMNAVLGTRFKNVMGYKSSPEAMLALERGEVEAHSTTWEAVKAVNYGWFTGKKIRILVQHSLQRHPELKEIPTSVELASGAENQAVMRIIMSASEIGKSYFTTPGVPLDRLQALRRAFDAMVQDKDFIAQLERIRGEVDPLTGEAVQKLVEELDTIKPDLLARVQATYRD